MKRVVTVVATTMMDLGCQEGNSVICGNDQFKWQAWIINVVVIFFAGEHTEAEEDVLQEMQTS